MHRAEDNRALLWACAALGGGLLLQLDRVPAWISATALVLMLWRLAAARAPLPLPGVALRMVLAVAAVLAVVARFHTLNGLAAGTSLLILMSSLKLLETTRRRDRLVLVGAGLFLLLAACLDSQSLARVPLYFGAVWLCCAALAVIATPGFPGRAALALAGRTLLIAAPLAVLLFLFFPRLAGAFWAIPRGEEAVTGLSDSMSPGGIGKLTTSYDIAFRVEFSQALPPPEERYWRGPVLHDFDGFTWRRGPASSAPPPLAFSGPAYRYHVMLEPSRNRFWFGLDTPAASPDPGVALTHDSELLATRPVSEPTRYDALSYTAASSSAPLSDSERRHDTSLPNDRNPRAVELAKKLYALSGGDAAFVAAALDYLRTGGFVYSLEPEKLGKEQVDDFLFRTHTGFCGHYASAFAVLMRAAGVPARVVTGYLGGEWNPIGGYLTVRQSDAHAWVEVWLAGRGWRRIDPTAVVEPERLRRGLADLLPDEMSASTRLLHAPWLAALALRWDAANAWWSDRVVKFDYTTQLDVLGRLGLHFKDSSELGWAFAAALLAWLAVIAWQLGRPGRAVRPDALARAYLRLCGKLARTGVVRAAHQGPLTYGAALRVALPRLGEGVQELLARYAQLRYGVPAPATRARDIGEFALAVRRLRVARA
jgi:protein-glutamine gamma-glutamyltransferase